MVIYSDKLTVADLERICAEMGIQLYENWNDFSGPRRRRFQTVIRPQQGEHGERWRKVRVDQFTGRTRRVWACSWDAHYVFMAALLELDPKAEIKSSVAHWRGRDDFHDRAPMTGDINWGSIMYPQYARTLCHEPMEIEDMRELACEIAGTQFEPDVVVTRHMGDGSTITTIPQAAIAACPHVIFSIEHYRANGSCKCDDPAENIMAEWGYTWDETQRRWTSG